MFDYNLDSLSALALKAAVWAADQLNNSQEVTRTVREKESFRDVVTDTDVLIETGIRKILADSCVPIFGEELANTSKLRENLRQIIWLIDPIDGTANYISAIPFFCHSVGLMVNNEFAVGAVANPSLSEVFFSIGGKGSYMNGKKLTTTSSFLKESLIGVSFSGKRLNGENRQREFDLFGHLNDQSRGCLRTGSAAMNICYTAANKLQVAYGIGSKIWDVAGALAIARQAGCKLFVEFNSNFETINYAVGAPGATEQIAEIMLAWNLANLSENKLAL